MPSEGLGEDWKGFQLLHTPCDSIQVTIPVVVVFSLGSLQVGEEELPNTNILPQQTTDNTHAGHEAID